MNSAIGLMDATTRVLAPSTREERAVEALYTIGHALIEQQRVSEAVKVFRVMLQLAPSDERSWLGLGYCHEELDQLSVASELYGAGSTVAQPRSARCLSALARTLRVLGDTAAADDYEQEALTVADESGVDLGGGA